MTYKHARRGAAISGALLLGIPVLEVLLGYGSAGPTHFVVGSFGLVLLAAARRER